MKWMGKWKVIVNKNLYEVSYKVMFADGHKTHRGQSKYMEGSLIRRNKMGSLKIYSGIKVA